MSWFATERLAEATVARPGTLRLDRSGGASLEIDLAAATAIDFVRVGEKFGPADEGWWAIVADEQVVAVRADCPMIDVLLRDDGLADLVADQSIIWVMSRPRAFRGTRDGVAVLDPATYAELTRAGVRETVTATNSFPRID